MTDYSVAATNNKPNTDRLMRTLDDFFVKLGQGFNSYLMVQSRAAEFERLNNLSDHELAEIELKRDDIPKYVFRDMIHI
ncbi:DUF1127 domain-containing protein [Ruegeria arenilitoris]|uniref:DUF1127 domain-containing protein n=1 Tax=Ruegeria arenilitoris TaxID=1173585 RepID=UPI00147FDEF9|nr:DUF1127 domain-containing protein [Ruegeria arenilitoris]